MYIRYKVFKKCKWYFNGLYCISCYFEDGKIEKFFWRIEFFFGKEGEFVVFFGFIFFIFGIGSKRSVGEVS